MEKLNKSYNKSNGEFYHWKPGGNNANNSPIISMGILVIYHWKVTRVVVTRIYNHQRVHQNYRAVVAINSSHISMVSNGPDRLPYPRCGCRLLYCTRTRKIELEPATRTRTRKYEFRSNPWERWVRVGGGSQNNNHGGGRVAWSWI